jgi:hypothetical protein
VFGRHQAAGVGVRRLTQFLPHPGAEDARGQGQENLPGGVAVRHRRDQDDALATGGWVRHGSPQSVQWHGGSASASSGGVGISGKDANAG